MILPKIYPITDTALSKISHAEQVERLIEGGATFIQLREKLALPKDFYESAKKALEIARRHRVKIIINDRVDIAFALGADGVHLGQEDLPPEYARKILGEKAIIGFSTHNPEQAAEAIKMPIDYAAFGPVFATTTKVNPDAVVGIEALSQVRQIVGNLPLVAIGGITVDNFQTVLQAGADSVALISGLVSAEKNIAERVRFFMN